MKKIHLLSFLILLKSSLFAQVAMQNVLPPSPRASAFHIYGDYPVNLSRGLADISIPLYTIEVNGKKFPVTLRYHHSGIKFYETEESNVATGWIIDYGGLISVTRLGKNDQYYSHVINETTAFSESDQGEFDTLQKVYNTTGAVNELDGEYDLYNYDFCGKSGKFIYDKNGKVIKFPYNSTDFKFSFTSNFLHHIDAYDEDGIHYRFGHSIDEDTPAFEGIGQNFSSMLLTDIELPEGKKIKYLYKTSSGGYRMTPAHYAKVVDYRIGALPPDGNQTYILPAAQQTQTAYDSKIISEIDFPNGKLVFNSDASGLRVATIDIYNNNEIVKKIKFNTTDFESMQKRYALNSLEFTDPVNNTESKYLFDYNSNRFPSGLNTNALDYWGYYNGNTGNTTLVPNFSIPFQDDAVIHNPPNRQIYTGPNQGCSRAVNEVLMQAYVLKKITYPTGGSSAFTYEANRYGADNKLGGGLRIRSITNDDGKGLQTVKTYVYGNGIMPLNPETPENYLRSSRNWQQFDKGDLPTLCDYVNYSYRVRYYGADMNSTLTLGGENQVYYTSVIEYMGTEDVNAGRTIYKYDYYGNGYHGYNRDGLFIAYLSDWNNFRSGNLLEKTVEKKAVDGTWGIINKTANTYTFVPKDVVNGLIVDKVLDLPPKYVPTMSCANLDLYFSTYYMLYNTWVAFKQDGQLFSLADKSLFKSYFYSINTGYNKLTGTRDTLNSTAASLASRTDYTYDIPDFLQPTQITSTKSNGDLTITRNKYVLSADYVTTAPYTIMAQKNMISPLLEQKVFTSHNSVEQLNGTTNTYFKQFFSNVIKPEKYQAYYLSNVNDKVTINTVYNNVGNLISQAKASGPVISYQWGYNDQYPVAEVKNAPSNDIFFDSFEEGNGNSSLGDAKTGHYSYNGTTTAYSKSLTGLDPGTYTLSYWKKTGGAWSFFINTAVLVAGTTYSLSISGLQIDDVRFYPSSAQMTTYTYDPLTGITSATDAKGQIVTYEYDNFQRLMNIRNSDNDITQHSEYHYQNQ